MKTVSTHGRPKQAMGSPCPHVVSQLAGIAVGVTCLLSCSPPTDSVADMQKREAQVLAAYCSPDLNAAEEGLFRYVRAFEELQRRGVVGYDYDHVFKVAHARLAVLYKQTGRTNEAQRHFRIGISHRNTAKARREGQAFTGGLDELENVVLKLDAAHDVKWRKNLKRESSGAP